MVPLAVSRRTGPRLLEASRAIAARLAMPGLPGPDAADALGIAICHAHAGHTLATIGAVSPLARRAHAAYRKGRGY